MDEDMQNIISGDNQLAKSALKSFLKKYDKVFTFPELKENDMHRNLWKALTNYLVTSNATNVHIDVLHAIRILSRDKSGLDDVMTETLIDTLFNCTGIKAGEFLNDPMHYNVELESAKCLCNLIFNSQVASTMCSKNGMLEGITQRLQNSRNSKPPSELLLFDMKILFLITALCPNLQSKLREDLNAIYLLSEALNNIWDDASKTKLDDMQVNIVCEILKSLFNITITSKELIDEKEVAQHIKLVTIVRSLLITKAQSTAKTHELINHIVNLLTNMPNYTFKMLYVEVENRKIAKELQFENWDMEAFHVILEFLQRTLNNEPVVSQQHQLLSPVLSSLLRIATVERPVRKYLRLQILPPLKDVSKRPEQGNTLRNGLCRLLSTPVNEGVFAAELLFCLCKEKINRMIKYTGYGNSVGLFARRGLMGKSSGDTSGFSSDSEDSDTEEYKEMKHGINPVLGCYEVPRPNPTANMTQEQKEYEAMKLVNLIDNMTKMGVVKPCKIGPGGRPEPVENVLELQAELKEQQVTVDSDSD